MEDQRSPLARRDFLRGAAAGSAVALLGGLLPDALQAAPDLEKPATNLRDATRHPRNENSMPGAFPGKVTEVYHDKVFRDGVPDQAIVSQMLQTALLGLLTPSSSRQTPAVSSSPPDELLEALSRLCPPAAITGIKVNPVAGKELSTTPEVVRALTDLLRQAGIPLKNIVIWDRREFQLAEAGFTSEAFPGIRLTGTECQDEKGAYYGPDGKLLSEHRIDKSWYYWADVSEEYDEETLPYMVNSGKYSYFSRIVTKEVDKIINVPVLKNAGASVTLALKNLAYGVITNTGRLHKQLWSETCAEVCAFPPVRDKVVLNIVDGLKGCFNGGPSANPQFIRQFNLLLAATDPVAIDRIGYDIILKRRIAEGIQKEESPRGRKFLELASNLKLGIADAAQINRITTHLT
ncbi:MAG TPA: DUF362 domain-containing protein [Bacteroidales bacterium]|nr:DUF362 domain-containing protein [Bacteroidales bacterium]HSA43939.1 DUF362 domain-containing protein [Bacteroidales bacterium]